MPPPLRTGRTILFSCITVCIAIIAVELGLHVIDWAASRLGPHPDTLPFHGVYQDKEWAAVLARESDSRGQIYHQYLTWISRPQKGKFVNLDPETGRKTWNPPDFKAPVTTVFVFGGSACWGYGARDDYTMPSDLSRRLNASTPHFRVYNYGEPGYTFTQGVLSLITRLQAGARPDYVVFYDGYNDMYGAYQSGKAGTLHNVAFLRQKLDSARSQLFWQGVKKWLNQNVYLYSRVFNPLILNPHKRFFEVGNGFSDQEIDDLAAGLVQYYARSLDLVDHLARAYGFKYVCFWQPTLYTEARTFPQETKYAVRLEDKKFIRLSRSTNQYLAEHPLIPHFHKLDDALQGRTQPGYLDPVHMTESGYEMVADRMFQVLRQEFALGD